jgi:hypothetical protein
MSTRTRIIQRCRRGRHQQTRGAGGAEIAIKRCSSSSSSSSSSSINKDSSWCITTRRNQSSRSINDRRGAGIGARPIYFQPRSSSLGSSSITPYELKGTTLTASIFTSNESKSMLYMTPGLGAALSYSPILGNLIRLGQRQCIPLSQSLYDDDDDDDDDDGDDGNTNNSNSNSDDKLLSNQLLQIGFLANNIYFQLIQESPIHLIKNKSKPAYYLTPGIIGSYLFHSTTMNMNTNTNTNINHKKNKKKTNMNGAEVTKRFRSVLKDNFGIKSNHIHNTKWTGISLARWMDLLLLIPVPPDNNNIDNNNNNDNDIEGTALHHHYQCLVSTLWLIALWGVVENNVSPSKESSKDSLSLVEYYKAIFNNKSMDDSFIVDELSSKSTSKFTEDDLSPNNINLAMDQLFDYYSIGNSCHPSSLIDDHTMAAARSLELVCAAIVLQQQHEQQQQQRLQPPVVSNGYYSPSSSSIVDDDENDVSPAVVADCTEVAIREILYILLWDDVKGNLDITRLPNTASESLKDVLVYENQQRFTYNNNSTVTMGQKSHQEQQQQQKLLGQIWFDLFSNLSNCDYLAKTKCKSRKKTYVYYYELAPTIENISKVLYQLLINNGGDDNSDEKDEDDDTSPSSSSSSTWTSLYDLSKFWSSPLSTSSNKLLVRQDRLRHHAQSGSIIEHEIISMQVQDCFRAIEIRLRCDYNKLSGMAAVTHLIQPRSDNKEESLFTDATNNIAQKLYNLCFIDNNHDNNNINNRKDNSRTNNNNNNNSLIMLCLALQSIHEFEYEEEGSDGSMSIVSKSLLLLSTPYGPDRRELLWPSSSEIETENDGNSNSNQQEQEQEQEHDEQQQNRRCQLILKKNILRACNIIWSNSKSPSYPNTGSQLLCWLLQESSIAIESSSPSYSSSSISVDDDKYIEEAILSLPISVLNNDDMLEAIQRNNITNIGGSSIVKFIRWKILKKISMIDVLIMQQSKSSAPLNELIELLSLLRLYYYSTTTTTTTITA